MLGQVSASHTQCMSQLSAPRRPPGAQPGCLTLFSSCHQAFAHIYHPSAQYCGIQLIHRFLLQVSSIWHRGLLLPASSVVECKMQDYWSKPTDILFKKQIQNNTPPCHGWAGCITEALMFIHRLLIYWKCLHWKPYTPRIVCVEELVRTLSHTVSLGFSLLLLFFLDSHLFCRWLLVFALQLWCSSN